MMDPALAALLQQTTGANALEGVKGITVTPGTFKSEKVDYPAISVQFHYACINVDPTSANPEPLEWSGNYFNLPVNEAAIPGSGVKDKGVGFRIDNDKQRFMGLAKVVLGADVALGHKSYASLIPALTTRINDAKVKAVSATIRVVSRTDNKVNPPKTYLSEWGVNTLSS